MKRLKFFGLVVAALVAVAVVVAMVWPSDEPSWQGKKLTEWLEQFAQNTFWISGANATVATNLSYDAKIAVEQIGTNGLPRIIKLLNTKDSSIRGKLINCVNKQRLFRIHIHTAEEKQGMAIIGVIILGTNARPAAPELLKLSNIERLRGSFDFFSGVLPVIAPDRKDLLNLLEECFRSNDPDVSRGAADYLCRNLPADAGRLGVAKKFPEFGPIAPPNNLTNAESAK